jgi:hypothetical protein
MSCCCKSHQGIYSAKLRHGTLDQPNKTKEDFIEYGKNRREFLKTFVGPLPEKISKPKRKYNVTKFQRPPSKSVFQRKAEWSAYIVNRRKKRDKSMPPWASKEKILEFYTKARQLSIETGVPHEVDHIVPSNHKLVCGLHCEFNLQVIPRTDNRQKNNKFTID